MSKLSINENKVQIIDTPVNFTKFLLPVRFLICGPSHSGKSTFICQLLKHKLDLFDKPFQRVIYCFPENLSETNKDYLESLKNEYSLIKINYGMPKVDSLGLKNEFGHTLLIIDDMFAKCANSAEICEIFTVLSHHLKISIILTTQNLFTKSKYGVNLSRNATAKILFKDKADSLYLNILSKRIFSNPNLLQKAFEWLHDNSDERYLVIDCSPLSHLPQKLMIRSRIFPMFDSKCRPIFFMLSNY